MQIKFYGTRGSFPVSNKGALEFGGNTSCISILNGQQQLIIDSGTGIYRLGKELVQLKEMDDIYVFYTHFHTDHIQGLPFFLPAYDQSFTIYMSSIQVNKTPKDLRNMIDTIMSHEFCPVSFEMLKADIHLYSLEEMKAQLTGLDLDTIELNHPGGAGGIKIRGDDGKTIAILTDNELAEPIAERYINFCMNVDVLIHDAHYTEAEYEETRGWGHSTYSKALALAEKASVGQLILTHFNPDHDDTFLNEQQRKCQSTFKNCLLAKEGLIVDV
ncbi:MAG: MBL fold metallo-hydrolase [Bacteroidota bacterium]